MEEVELSPITWIWDCPNCNESNETYDEPAIAESVTCEYCEHKYDVKSS